MMVIDCIPRTKRLQHWNSQSAEGEGERVGRLQSVDGVTSACIPDNYLEQIESRVYDTDPEQPFE